MESLSTTTATLDPARAPPAALILVLFFILPVVLCVCVPLGCAAVCWYFSRDADVDVDPHGGWFGRSKSRRESMPVATVDDDDVVPAIHVAPGAIDVHAHADDEAGHVERGTDNHVVLPPQGLENQHAQAEPRRKKKLIVSTRAPPMDAGSAGGTLEVAAAGGEAAPRLASMVRLRPVVLILQASGCDDELVEIDRTSCTSLHVPFASRGRLVAPHCSRNDRLGQGVPSERLPQRGGSRRGARRGLAHRAPRHSTSSS